MDLAPFARWDQVRLRSCNERVASLLAEHEPVPCCNTDAGANLEGRISMQDLDVPVYFYVPSAKLVEAAPDHISQYWLWVDEAIKQAPAVRPKDQRSCTWAGPYNWTIQTFLYLKAYGFPCALTASLPERGVILAHSDFLPTFLGPESQQFIVELKPDRVLSCIYANFVIVQNRNDPIRRGIRRLLIKSAFMNYWPQPGLIPRDVGRGDRFENICFMGNPEQFLISPERLALKLKELNLKWEMVPRHRWHDYSNVDAVVAVRAPKGTRGRRGTQHLPNRKPATKLYNSWLAGVPAVLSPEIAYQQLKKSELDFLEARDIREILRAIKRLMRNPALRQSMADNGRIRGQEFKPDNIAREWIRVLKEEIIPRYRLWSQSAYRRRWFLFARNYAYKTNPNLYL
jgi:hypothetical protein